MKTAFRRGSQQKEQVISSGVRTYLCHQDSSAPSESIAERMTTNSTISFFRRTQILIMPLRFISFMWATSGFQREATPTRKSISEKIMSTTMTSTYMNLDITAIPGKISGVIRFHVGPPWCPINSLHMMATLLCEDPKLQNQKESVKRDIQVQRSLQASMSCEQAPLLKPHTPPNAK